MQDEVNHHWIKTALAKRGISFSAIAADLGLTPTTVCGVSRGRGRSARIENAIAEAIGFSVAEIWPDREGGEASRFPARTKRTAGRMQDENLSDRKAARAPTS